MRHNDGVGSSRARTSKGAAAVEAALFVSVVLVPLMLGVFYYGLYFWKLQAVPTLDANVDQAGFVGAFCQTALQDRVESEVLADLADVDQGSGMPVASREVTASVLSSVPGQLGVDVQVTVRVQVMSESTLIPLPADGSIEHVSWIRLENVTISPVCA